MTVGVKENHHYFHLQIPHIHFHHHEKKDDDDDDDLKGIPKGCVAVMVGSHGEEQQRFVIPVIYINHPLFMELLKEAEEEYGFDQKGPITIPCHVDDFIAVRYLIDKENSDHHHHHHHHHHNHVWCFRVWFHHHHHHRE